MHERSFLCHVLCVRRDLLLLLVGKMHVCNCQTLWLHLNCTRQRQDKDAGGGALARW